MTTNAEATEMLRQIKRMCDPIESKMESIQEMMVRCHEQYGRGESLSEYATSYCRFMSRDTDGTPDIW